MLLEAEEASVRILRPSDLKTLAFCPRLFFFQHHIGRELTLRDVVRILRGIALHIAVQSKGLETGEFEEVETDVIGELWGWIVLGRADAVTADGDAVVEIKSGRPPAEGMWFSDYLQALVYALVLGKQKVRLIYRGGVVREAEVSGDDVKLLKRVLQYYERIKQGYFPEHMRRTRFCSRCPFRELCAKADSVSADWDEPVLPVLKV